MSIRSAYWRIADAFTFPLALIAAIGAIENSYSYGNLGAWISGLPLSAFTACVEGN